MLAQNFKSAIELGIPEDQVSALQKTLVLLETGRLKHAPYSNTLVGRGAPFTGHFNMAGWHRSVDCGTACCIGGTAELVGSVVFDIIGRPAALKKLFYPDGRMDTITPDQAATALRSYLTTGDARWDLALSRSPQGNADV